MARSLPFVDFTFQCLPRYTRHIFSVFQRTVDDRGVIILGFRVFVGDHIISSFIIPRRKFAVIQNFRSQCNRISVCFRVNFPNRSVRELYFHIVLVHLRPQLPVHFFLFTECRDSNLQFAGSRKVSHDAFFQAVKPAAGSIQLHLIGQIGNYICAVGGITKISVFPASHGPAAAGAPIAILQNLFIGKLERLFRIRSIGQFQRHGSSFLDRNDRVFYDVSSEPRVSFLPQSLDLLIKDPFIRSIHNVTVLGFKILITVRTGAEQISASLIRKGPVIIKRFLLQIQRSNCMRIPFSEPLTNRLGDKMPKERGLIRISRHIPHSAALKACR